MFLAAILKAHMQAEEPIESAVPEQKPEEEAAATDVTGRWPSFKPRGNESLDERSRWV
jgi:hypothetical protein